MTPQESYAQCYSPELEQNLFIQILDRGNVMLGMDLANHDVTRSFVDDVISQTSVFQKREGGRSSTLSIRQRRDTGTIVLIMLEQAPETGGQEHIYHVHPDSMRVFDALIPVNPILGAARMKLLEDIYTGMSIFLPPSDPMYTDHTR